jgi:tetratricopeptide (TPR) repeat protein
MRTLGIILLSISTLPAQKKPVDLCAPPPGGAAPALPARLMTGQGRVHFPITTSRPEAQEFFDQGLAQMHSFWATEAERSFLQAAALDPQAPMPQWGIAMVASGDYRPRFQLFREGVPKGDAKPDPRRTPQGGPGRALAAAQKARELAAVAGKATPLEKLYVDAVWARRNPDEKDPDGAYIAGLRAIVAAHPEEVEARTYLALHLMSGFTTPDRQPRPGSMEAVEILRELLVRAPEHPGVHHYVIHGWEGSTFAKHAWPSCRRYPQLVPNIPHALHMPGHIWAQTGKWDEAVQSFSDAARNELGYIKADQLYSTGHHGHNVHFLVTSYCFRGDYEKALETARGLFAFAETPREASQVDNYHSAHRQGWFALLRTLVHFQKWDEILDGSTLPVYDRPREQAWRHWARGLALSARGDTKGARAEAAAMDQSIRELADKTKEEAPKTLTVARAELDGHLAYSAHKTAKALGILETAARQERALRYSEPPWYPRPVLEVLGRIAAEQGRLKLAESAFREALEQYPESRNAVDGLSNTLRREGKPTLAAGL